MSRCQVVAVYATPMKPHGHTITITTVSGRDLRECIRKVYKRRLPLAYAEVEKDKLGRTTVRQGMFRLFESQLNLSRWSTIKEGP